MGQSWAIINIDGRKALEARMLKLGEFFNDGITNRGAATRLSRLRGLPRMPKIPSKAIRRQKFAISRHRLLSLPAEIFWFILEEIADEFDDIVCFAATCHFLWDFCAPIIDGTLHLQSWAGCRMMCIGNLDYGDLPAGLLSAEEQKELYDAMEADRPASKRGKPFEWDDVSFYRYAKEHYTQCSSSSMGSFMQINFQDLKRERDVRGAPLAALSVGMSLRDTEATILRNLSKKFFVRAEAVEELNDSLPQDLFPSAYRYANFMHRFDRPDESLKDVKYRYGLGDALMSRICWSSYPSCAMGKKCEDLTRGPWAGDRFDLTTQDEFGQQEDYAEWTDASEEVCKALGECHGG